MDESRLAEWCARWGLGPDAAADLVRLVTSGGTGSSEATFTDDPTGEVASAGAPAHRYTLGAPVGRGTTGEVLAARDHLLDRDVALKVLRASLVGSPSSRARFLDEAKLTAGLQHPGVVAVHDLGTLPDGRPYFAMQLVRGPSLRDRIRAVHAASAGGHYGVTDDGWSLRRLVETFRRVCETVGHAHARGVVHRDLKPANVVVGDHGEVRVLDWGLAGAVASGTEGGTPAYMAPEQARGEPATPRSDVYALGGILYEVLAGRAPFQGDASSVLGMLRRGETPVPAERVAGPRPPPPLLSLCRACLEPEPERRPADAAAVAQQVGRWLDDLDRVARAEADLARADALPPQIDELRARAAALRAEADARLRELPTWAPEDDKGPAWDLQTDARGLETRAAHLEGEREAALRSAITLAPDHRRAVERVVELLIGRHRAAEQARDPIAAELPAGELARVGEGEHGFASARARAWLTGRARLRLSTDPEVEVVAFPLEERRRRLVRGEGLPLGRTPIDMTLPPGRYLLELRAEDGTVTPYPIVLERLGEWTVQRPVPLLPASALGPDDRFVPEGPFLAGGDPAALRPWAGARLWCDGFVIRRFAFTFAEVLDLLQWAWRQGLHEEVRFAAPRATPGVGPSDPIVAVDDDGARLLPDPMGVTWDPRWPCVHVDAFQADALAALAARRDGLPWRLPGEFEWEKAARGVDGRWFPMGDAIDPAWACLQGSHQGNPLPAPVDSFPADVSPYGVRGLAGNVRTWCRDGGTAEPELGAGRVVVGPATTERMAPRGYRGGSWSAPANACRSAGRPGLEGRWRDAFLGLRLVRPVPAHPSPRAGDGAEG